MIATVDEAEPILRPYMPELDVLRGIAVLLVFGYHGLFWSVPAAHLTRATALFSSLFGFGWTGVQLFFLLSGFLITDVLIRSKQQHRRYYAPFYIRRALRIVPACALLIAILLATGSIDAKFALISLAFSANLAPLFGVALQYPPLWSLAVEEQFYAIWPAAIRRLQPRAIGQLAFVALLSSPLLRAYAYFHAAEGLYFYTWFNLDGFALGAIFGVIARGSRHNFRRFGVACFAFGVALTAAGIPFGILTREHAIGAALQSTCLYLLFGGLMSFALLTGSGRHAELFRIGPLHRLGDISYGLYLVHLLCFTGFDRAAGSWTTTEPRGLLFLTLRFIVAGGSAVILAALSRRYYESTFLSLKDSLGRR